MIYAISDLHGCDEKYFKMLEKIRFSDEDTLYVLGDVIDRGEGGIAIILDMMKRKNVVPLLGNHEYVARSILSCLENRELLGEDKLDGLISLWCEDGGTVTLRAYEALSATQKEQVLFYMNSMSIYKKMTVKDRKFLLSHTIPEKERMRTFSALKQVDFILGEPDYERQYYRNTYLVTGHTPTGLIDKDYKGKIYRKHYHIAIDCGAVFSNPLGCICLDTFEEYYVE